MHSTTEKGTYTYHSPITLEVVSQSIPELIRHDSALYLTDMGGCIFICIAVLGRRGMCSIAGVKHLANSKSLRLSDTAPRASVRRRHMKVSENDEFRARKSKVFAPIPTPRANKCTAGASSDSINTFED